MHADCCMIDTPCMDCDLILAEEFLVFVFLLTQLREKALPGPVYDTTFLKTEQTIWLHLPEIGSFVLHFNKLGSFE